MDYQNLSWSNARGYSYFPFYDPYRQFYAGLPGLATGNATIDALLSIFLMFLGIPPRPAPGAAQSMYDAMWLRQRSFDIREVQRRALASSLLFRKIGVVDPDSLTLQFLGMFAGDPDGIVAKLMAPAIGGNPMRAQMQLMAKMTGMTMGAFGRVSPLTVPESQALMEALYNNFYLWRPITQTDVENYRNRYLGKVETLFQEGKLTPEFHRQVQKVLRGEQTEAALRQLYGGEENEQINKLLTKIEESFAKIERNTSTTQAQMSKLMQDLQNGFSDILDSVVHPETKAKYRAIMLEAFKAFEDAMKTSKLDFNAIKQKLPDQFGAVAGLITGLEQIQRDAAAGVKRPVAVDLFKTYGIPMQNITEAFAIASRLRLVGRPNVPIEQQMEAFAQNAPQVLEALQSLLGRDTPIEKQMEFLNVLLGPSTEDTTDPVRMANLARQLYRIKGVAHVLGFGQPALLSLMEQGREIVARSPTLYRMEGLDVLDLQINALNRAAALVTTQGAEYVRRRGGERNIALEEMMQTFTDLESVDSRRLATLYGYFKTVNNQQGIQAIQNVLANPAAYLTELAGGKMYNYLSQQTGIDIHDLVSRIETTSAAADYMAIALKDKLPLAKIQSEIRMGNLIFALENVINPGRSPGSPVITPRLLQMFFMDRDEFLREYGVQIDDKWNVEETTKRFLNKVNISIENLSSDTYQRFLTAAGLQIRGARLYDKGEFEAVVGGTGFLNILLRNITPVDIQRTLMQFQPRIQRRQETIEKFQQLYTEASVDFAKRFAPFLGPASTQFWTDLLKGGLTENYIKQTIQSWRLPGDYDTWRVHFQTLQNLGTMSHHDHTYVDRLQNIIGNYYFQTGFIPRYFNREIDSTKVVQVAEVINKLKSENKNVQSILQDRRSLHEQILTDTKFSREWTFLQENLPLAQLISGIPNLNIADPNSIQFITKLYHVQQQMSQQNFERSFKNILPSTIQHLDVLTREYHMPWARIIGLLERPDELGQYIKTLPETTPANQKQALEFLQAHNENILIFLRSLDRLDSSGKSLIFKGNEPLRNVLIETVRRQLLEAAIQHLPVVTGATFYQELSKIPEAQNFINFAKTQNLITSTKDITYFNIHQFETQLKDTNFIRRLTEQVPELKTGASFAELQQTSLWAGVIGPALEVAKQAEEVQRTALDAAFQSGTEESRFVDELSRVLPATFIQELPGLLSKLIAAIESLSRS